MTRALASARRGPRDPEAVVVFLHGYGADGADLLGLAEPLAPHLPGVAFFAPDAPEPCAGNPFGRQWFPIPWLDGSSEAAAQASMAQSVADLDVYLDTLLADEGVAPSRLILFGFSQGTMMALHVAPRRPQPVAGVVGFSGRLLAPERLAGETLSRPPLLLVHGNADDMVPFASMGLAAETLASAGFEVATFAMPGTGHGIGPDGLGAAVGWMRDRLGMR